MAREQRTSNPACIPSWVPRLLLLRLQRRLHPYDEWLRKNWRPPHQRNHWPLIRTQPTPLDDLADAALARRLLRRLDSRSHISVGREVDQQAPSPARAVELLKICSIHFQSKTIDGNNIAIKEAMAIQRRALIDEYVNRKIGVSYDYFLQEHNSAWTRPPKSGGPAREVARADLAR